MCDPDAASSAGGGDSTFPKGQGQIHTHFMGWPDETLWSDGEDGSRHVDAYPTPRGEKGAQT